MGTQLPETCREVEINILRSKFHIHGSVHRESNLVTVQQDANVFSLLYFCRQLYMFRVFSESVPTQQRERMVADPVNQYQKLYLQLYKLLMMGVNTRNL